MLPSVANRVRVILSGMLRTDNGASSIEYAIIAAGITLAIVGAVAAVGTRLLATYNTLPTLF